MKKLINDPQNVVPETLAGFEAVYADYVKVYYDEDDNPYVVRADAPVAGKVALVSGGGSGHEPLHAGYVGMGMLDAAVPGAVFTSPSPGPILEATKAVNAGAGVLHIVKNYTGDVQNFEIAAEDAADEGIEVKAIVVDDDVAVQDSLWTTGRRGVAGTVLLEKIVGAAAQAGKNLDECLALAEKVNGQVRSMGVALTACTVPHAGKPSFDLPDDEIEVGIGIHGEPGRRREKYTSADAITDELIKPVLDDLKAPAGSQVLLFVNGMGGTPESELYIVYKHAREVVESYGLSVARSLVGNYITSLEMQGCSVTVLLLDDELTGYWDAPVDTPAMKK
ncbi:MAG: dihydroxyacetone kinase subunit DhaK [Propionibacteriaceae bacterium]|jgi:dihydroxyacetone kinase-like protein|nr:dihydroxyacetone kinase subunit DhaK [Propionibacteriaceae bacterium]